MEDSGRFDRDHPTYKFVRDIENSYGSDLRQRFFSFAVEVFSFLKSIDSSRLYDVFRYQLSRSASARGANYEEAQGAFSKKEFASKIGICLKEARETNYFLRLVAELKISNKSAIELLVKESDEIQKILATILIKVRKQL